MAYEDVEQLWKAMQTLEAQESMRWIQAASYPHTKKEAQEKLHRALDRVADPEKYDNPVRVTPQQLAKMIHGG